MIINYKEKKIKNPAFSIGIIADPQYWDGDRWRNRFFRQSLNKLKQAAETCNARPLAFNINLGDLIDHDFSSFDPALETLKNFNASFYHLLGNHDFEVSENELSRVPEKLGLQSGYYSFDYRHWRFIMLNGNEISLFANTKTHKNYRKAQDMLKNLEASGKPNAQVFNGGIGYAQLNWLEEELNLATKNQERVIICCHYPVLPQEDYHRLWNAEAVLEVINRYSCVKAYFNGHHHAGNYVFSNQKHFLNFQGMVETENENAFAIAHFYEGQINIEGFGREPSRTLSI